MSAKPSEGGSPHDGEWVGWAQSGPHPPRAESAPLAVVVILVLALLLGAGLRFYRLGGYEIGGSEAVAWSVATAPDLSAVFHASQRLDPGKSGVYELLLHLWIGAFGDHLATLRAFSAICGTLTILLIFGAVRELFNAFDGRRSAAGAYAAAFAALLYACNFLMIHTDRTARMYALMLTAMLAQVWCFARAHRYRGNLTVIATAFFTDLAVASNFAAALVFAAEAVWLGYLGLRRWLRGSTGELSFVRPALALILAGLIFIPLAMIGARGSALALHSGTWNFIQPHPPWWPLRMVQVMTGNAAFFPMLGLAIYGAIAAMREHGLPVRFVLCWLVIPFVLIVVVSYAIAPSMEERFVLGGLVAFLVLVALGLAMIPWRSLQYALAALLVAQSLAHVHHHWRRPEDVQWHEAIAFAMSQAPAGTTIVAIPPDEPVFAMRYYLPAAQRPLVTGADAVRTPERQWTLRCGPAPLLIAATELPRESKPAIEACYPRLLKSFRRVEVRSR